MLSLASASAAWLNEDWSTRVKLTIDSDKVNGDLSNFPVYIDLSDLNGTGFFSLVANDGSDIRITKSNGHSLVPREIVSINTTEKTGELYFLANGTLSGTSNSDWYLYYGNNTATEPSSISTYGSSKVWANNYLGVFHMNQDPSQDGARQFTLANSEYLNLAGPTGMDTTGGNETDWTIAAWVYFDSTGLRFLFGRRASSGGGFEVFSRTNQFEMRVHDGVQYNTAVKAYTQKSNQWYFFLGDYDSATNTLSIDANNSGAPATASLTQEPTGVETSFNIGLTTSGFDYMDGRVSKMGFWRRKLTSSEKTWLYNNGAGRLYGALGDSSNNGSNLKTSLISYWNLNESSGNATDSHGSNNLTDNNTVTAAAAASTDYVTDSSSNANGAILVGSNTNTSWSRETPNDTFNPRVEDNNSNGNTGLALGYSSDGSDGRTSLASLPATVNPRAEDIGPSTARTGILQGYLANGNDARSSNTPKTILNRACLDNQGTNHLILNTSYTNTATSIRSTDRPSTIANGTSLTIPNSGTVIVPSNPTANDSSGTATVTCWVKMTQSGQMTLGSGLGPKLDSATSIRPRRGGSLAGGGNVLSQSAIGQWLFIGTIYHSSTADIYVYKENGSLMDSFTGISTSTNPSTQTTIVSNDGSAAGLLDDYRVYKDQELSTNNLRFIAGFTGGTDPAVTPTFSYSFDEGNTVSKNGQSMDFGGATQHVSIQDHSSLDLTNNFSIAFWMNPDAGGNTTVGLVSKSTGADAGYTVGLDGDGEIRFPDWNSTAESNVVPTAGQWIHVTAIQDSGENRLYVDGVLQTTNGSESIVTNNEPLQLGQIYSTANFEYNGKLDDVRIYNDVLSQSELIYLISNGQVGSNPGTANLAVRYDFNETNTRKPPGSQVMNFDGNNDYIYLESAPSPTDTVSVCSWTLKTDTDLDYIFDRLQTTDGFGLNTDTNGNPRFSINGGFGLATSSVTIADSTWHHICGTYDKNAGSDQVKIYVDGVETGTATYTTSIDYSPEPRKLIGNTNGSNFLTGKMANLQVWTNTLTAAEIENLSLMVSNPIASPSIDLDFEESNLRSFTSSQGSWKSNGSDRYISVSDPGLNSGPWTMSYWIKAITNTDNDRITANIDASVGPNPNQFSIRFSSTRLQAWSTLWENITNVDISTNIWHNLVYTLESNGTLTSYIDGVRQRAYDDNYKLLKFSLGSNFIFSGGPAGNFAEAQYSDLRLYNSVLSPAQIDSLANGDDVQTNIVGHWKLDDSPVQTYDSSMFNDGASFGSMNSADIVNGQIGKALAFDGVDDYILGGSNLGLSGNDNLSISAWAMWDNGTWNANFPSIMGLSTNGSGSQSLSLTMSSGRPALDFWNDRIRADNPLSTQQWYFFTATKAAGTKTANSKVYVDGAGIATSLENSDAAPNIVNSPYIIGRLDGTRWFEGPIDEVRFSSVVRSNNWVTTEYNNQNSPSTFYTVGPAESNGGNLLFYYNLF